MKKKIAQVKIFIVLFFMFCSIFSFSGCNKENVVLYDEMDLEIAYVNGYLTQEHLKSIAYYYNEETAQPNFGLIPKVELTQEIEDNIKLSYLQRSRIKDYYPNATIKDISVYKYYGTYNDYAIVYIRDSLFMYDLIIEPKKIIGGVTFYNYCGLIVYNINN